MTQNRKTIPRMQPHPGAFFACYFVSVSPLRFCR